MRKAFPCHDFNTQLIMFHKKLCPKLKQWHIIDFICSCCVKQGPRSGIVFCQQHFMLLFKTVKNDMKSCNSHLNPSFLKQAIRLEIKGRNCCGVPLHLQTVPVNIVSQKWGAIYRCQSQFKIGCTAQGSGVICNKGYFPTELALNSNLAKSCLLITYLTID